MKLKMLLKAYCNYVENVDIEHFNAYVNLRYDSKESSMLYSYFNLNKTSIDLAEYYRSTISTVTHMIKEAVVGYVVFVQSLSYS